MDFSRMPLFGMISRRMDWLSQRQQVLAQNIANADTPNYRPHDLRALDFRAELRGQTQRLSATTTSGQHQVSKIIPPPHRVDTPKAKETTLSGNSVEMDTELMKVADTSMDYQLTTNIYRRQIAMLRAAIGRPGQ